MNRNNESVNRMVVEVSSYGRGKDAVGRTPEGHVVFVSGAVPGDIVEVQILETHTTWLRGVADRIVRPSPDRRESPCIHYTRDACGGCSWILATESRQQKEKYDAVVREVGRIFPQTEVRPLRDDVPSWGYRRRTRFGYRVGALGFRKRSQRLIFDLEHCLVLDDRLSATLPKIRIEASRLAAKHGNGNLDVAVMKDGKVSIGGDAQVFQQPSAVTEKILTELILEALPDTQTSIAELFAGGGTFTAPLLSAGHSVCAWEVDRRSVRQLQETCPTATVQRLDLSKEVGRLDLQDAKIIVLDPPRAGAKALMPALIRSVATRIVYISCDLATLCRDLRILADGGFKLTYAVPIDAFPQTPHIEIVAVLDRI